MAGKSLRFPVYRAIEFYVVVSFVLFLLSIGLEPGTLKTILDANVWLVVLAAIAHHAKLATRKPWTVCGAAFEAFIIWAAYNWGLSHFITVQGVGGFCVFVFVARYWVRGENEVNVTAFMNIVKLSEQSVSEKQGADGA